jgi:hypothetical protein
MSTSEVCVLDASDLVTGHIASCAVVCLWRLAPVRGRSQPTEPNGLILNISIRHYRTFRTFRPLLLATILIALQQHYSRNKNLATSLY